MKNKSTYIRARLSGAAASVLVFAITTVNVGISAPSGSLLPEPPPPPVKAILRTVDNRPITVNGANAISGATVLTGSMIETPDQVSAVISLGSAGDLEIEPNTVLKLEYDENGNMKVTLVRGCVTARTKKNIVAEISTEQGVAATTEPKKKKNVTVCYPPGSSAPIVTFPLGAAAVGGHSFVPFLVAAIITGGTIPFAFRGGNPSAAAPSP